MCEKTNEDKFFFDSEIERTTHRNNKETRKRKQLAKQKVQQEETFVSSTFNLPTKP